MYAPAGRPVSGTWISSLPRSTGSSDGDADLTVLPSAATISTFTGIVAFGRLLAISKYTRNVSVEKNSRSTEGTNGSCTGVSATGTRGDPYGPTIRPLTASGAVVKSGTSIPR